MCRFHFYRKICRNFGSLTSPNSSNFINLIRAFSVPDVPRSPTFQKNHFSRFCSLSSSKDLILHHSSIQTIQTVEKFSSCKDLVLHHSSIQTAGNSYDNQNHVASLADKVYEAIMSDDARKLGLEKTLDSLGLKMTTELVDAVMNKLLRNEKLALRFFIWAGHQDGYAHGRRTYNEMIDMLSNTRCRLKQFGVLCEVLDHMKRKKSPWVSSEDLMAILKSYTEKNMVRVKKFANKRKIMVRAPEIAAFNMLLESLCKCGLAREGEVLLHRLKKTAVPNENTYSILFFGWCRVRDFKKAIKVLEETIKWGYSPDNFTYNTGIESFCSVGMVAEARELFEFMKKGSALSSPTAKTYSIMIVALAKDGQMDECFRLLADMRNSGCVPDVLTYKDLIEGLCMAGKLDAAYKVLEEMGNTGFPPDILTYNCFLKVICDLKKPKEALALCKKMIQVGCEPSVHTYNMMIAMFFELKEPDRAIGIWFEMDKRRCWRTPDTYGIMIYGLLCSERVVDACSLLDEVIDRRMKLTFKMFDALMSKFSEMGNLNAIHRLSQHMNRFYSSVMSERLAKSERTNSKGIRRHRRNI